MIVAGHLVVEPDRREACLRGCVAVVEQARAAPGCFDLSLGADLLDPSRIVVLEHWGSGEAVEASRGSGPADEQAAAMIDASVVEHEVVAARTLT